MKLYDLEIEKAVLAIMALDISVIPNIQQQVKISDFFDHFHKEIYEAISKLFKKNSVDLVSLNTETQNKNPVYVAELTSTVASSANWEYYVKQLKQYSMFRGFKKVLEDVREVRADNISETINKTIESLTNISSSTSGSTIVSMQDAVKSITEKIEYACKHKKSKDLTISSGFENLDDLFGGFRNEYIIIGARPSVGKTAFACNMMTRMLKNNVKIGFITAEMNIDKIMYRMLADMSTLNSRQIKDGFVSKSGVTKITSNLETLYDKNFYFDEKSKRLEDIVSSIRIMKHIHKVDIVFIDHAGMIGVGEKLQHFEKETKKSKTLKSLQTELDIPIVLLSQLGRQVEGKAPSLADLRGSGSYEEDADCVMLIHRKRLYLSQEEVRENKSIDSEIIVAKNRDGEIGIVNMEFFPTFTQFREKAFE